MKNRLEPKYKIFIVDDDEFDKLDEVLPYMTKEKLKDKLGFAHPGTNEAYIRKTGVAEIDDSTLEHEFYELLAKASPDEVDGIRYKSGGGLGKVLGPVVGGLITALSGGTLAPLGAAVGAGISGGTQLYTQSTKPEKYGAPSLGSVGKAALLGGAGAYGLGKAGTGFTAGFKGAEAGTNFLGKVSSGIKGAVVGTPGTTTTGTSTGAGFGSVPGASPSGVSTLIPGTAPTSGLLGSAGKIGGSLIPSSDVAKYASSIPGSSSGVGSLGALSKGGSQVTQSQTPSFTKQISDFASKPSTVLGAGSLLASTAVNSPKFEFPSEFYDLQSKLKSGESLSALGEQAKSELSKILSAGPTEFDPEKKQAYLDSVNANIEKNYELAQKQLDAVYTNAGVYGSGEHLAEKAKLQEQLAKAKSGIAAEFEKDLFQYGSSQKYQAIQDSLGVDKQTMDDLVGLTGLSVQAAALAYGAKVEDVMAIRESLGTLGTELILKGSGTGGLI